MFQIIQNLHGGRGSGSFSSPIIGGRFSLGLLGPTQNFFLFLSFSPAPLFGHFHTVSPFFKLLTSPNALP